MKNNLRFLWGGIFTSCLILLLWLFCINAAYAQTNSLCQAYSIPMAGVPCGQGYTGTKFPMRTKTCPDGKITDGLTYNTDNCKPLGYQAPDTNATNCAITPGEITCMRMPTLSGCPAGRHWVTTGTKIAHCVDNDPACGWGKSLIHDAQGNPSCITNTCPSNQVLQADGISCGCAVGLVWNGATCVAPCVPTSSIQSKACAAGYTGNQTRTATATCPLGTMVYSAWDASACVLTCPADVVTSGTCPAGYTGSTTITTTYGGAACTASKSTDTSGCSPIVCPAPSSTSGSCGAGYTGTTSITTTYSGASCTPKTTTDRSGCSSCTTSTSTEDAACGVGYTGSKSRTVSTNSCTGAVSYGAWDSSSCIAPVPRPKCAYSTWFQNTLLWPNGFQKSYQSCEKNTDCTVSCELHTCDKAGVCD